MLQGLRLDLAVGENSDDFFLLRRTIRRSERTALRIHRDRESAGQRLARSEQFERVRMAGVLLAALAQEGGRRLVLAVTQRCEAFGERGQSRSRGTRGKNRAGLVPGLLQQA